MITPEVLNTKSVRLLIEGLLVLIGLFIFMSFAIVGVLIYRIDKVVENYYKIVSILAGLPIINIGVSSFGFFGLIKKLGISDNRNKKELSNERTKEVLFETSKFLINKLIPNSENDEDTSKEQLIKMLEQISKISS